MARDLLVDYVRQLDDLTLGMTCRNAREAAQALERHEVDLVLLDIEMPRLSGIELLRTLPVRPLIIFTTAYPDYALEGYELDVVDYLLKPISFERFQRGIERARCQIDLRRQAQAFQEQQSLHEQYLLVKEGYDHHKVLLQDIHYVASLKEYVQYHTAEGRLMELRSLTHLEDVLPADRFLRIHRSYIVAVDAVQHHEGHTLVLRDGARLPIGKTYRKKVLARLFTSPALD